MLLTKKLALVALALGSAVPAFAADPLKIGLVLPMSGPFAAYGKQIEHGVKLYLAANGDSFSARSSSWSRTRSISLPGSGLRPRDSQ
jgi:branched-chain amino acid transport system substrate-binding protein